VFMFLGVSQTRGIYEINLKSLWSSPEKYLRCCLQCV
jgi:hypothetical protein